MKKLIKLLFFFILFIVLLVVGSIAFLYFTISDSTDNAPTELYNEEIILDSQMAKVIDESLSSSDELDFTFTEDDINLLIFSIIRDSVNPEFYNNDCSSDSCKYIKTIELDNSYSLIGGKKVLIKNAYSSLTEDTLTFIVTLDILGVKTNLNVGFKMEEENGVYTVTMKKLGLGGLNLMSGIGKWLLKPVLSTIGFTESDINKSISDKNIPLTFDIKKFSFTFNKEDLGEVLLGLVESEDNSSQEILGEFANILSSAENNLLKFGFFNDGENKFGLKLNLEEMKYQSSTDGVPLYKLDYDTYEEKMSTLLSAGLSSENFKIASNFIIYGYQKLTDYEKLEISNIDFSSVNISNKNLYTGLINDYNTNIEEYISNQLYTELRDISDKEVSVNIDENIINQILYSNGLVGNGYNSYYKKDGQNKIIYTGVEAVWMDIVDGQLGLKMLYNLNGTRVCLFTSFNNNTPNSAKIEADFEELRIGSIEFSENFKSTILNLLKESFDSSSMQIITIGDNSITIDANKFIEEFKGESSLSDLIDIFENEDMIKLGLNGLNMIDNGYIDFSISLDKIDNEENLDLSISTLASGFDMNAFIQNKTQTLAISNMSSEQKMTFTEKEFGRLIYQETSGYQGFINTTTLPDGVTEFTYQIKGIILELQEEIVKIKFVMDINGLETVITIEGDVITTPTEETVIIKLKDTILIGDVSTSNDFLLNILGDNTSNFKVMTYDNVEKSFILSSATFEKFMAVGGDSTPLTVDKIRVKTGRIEVVVSYIDPTLDDAINTVSNVISTVLSNDFLDETTFDTTESDQVEAVNELSQTLSNITTILNDPNQALTSSDTDLLIENINNLNDVNQQEFLNQIESESSSADLLNLYNTLFGK